MASDTMWERFTDRATRVIHFAQEEAKYQGVSVVGTEHLLVGLVTEKSGLAAQELRRYEVTLARVRAEMAAHPYSPEGVNDNPARLTLSPLAKKALEYSLQEHRRLAADVGPMTLDTEHLLLGILRTGSACNGGELLERLHVDLPGAYQALSHAISQSRPISRLSASWATIRYFLRKLLPTSPAAAISRHPRQPASPAHAVTISTPPVSPETSDINAFDIFRAAGELLVERDRILELKSIKDEEIGIHLTERKELLRLNEPALAKMRGGFAYAYRYPRSTDLYCLHPSEDEARCITHLFAIDARVKTACGDIVGAVLRRHQLIS